MNTQKRQHTFGLTAPGHVSCCAILVLALAAGCHKNGGASDAGIAPTDPAVAANLANLSREVRRALPGLNKSRDFANFTNVAHVEVPPPPPGQKYAINERWKVILVEDK